MDNPPSDRKLWPFYSKAKLMEKEETSNRQRIIAAQITINCGVSFIFELFQLNNYEISFISKCDEIISDIIKTWNLRTILKWKGVKNNKNNILSNIKWKDKKKGYWHKCTNYIHQYKYVYGHALWNPIFKEINHQTLLISNNQYPNDPNMANLLYLCLLYGCIYSLFVSKIKFFQAAAKPMIINTAIKNGKFIRYLKQLDNGLNIFQWNETEKENNQGGDQYICKHVRKKIIHYLKNKIQSAFNQFHQKVGNENSKIIIDFKRFESVTRFNKKGDIQQDEKEKEQSEQFYKFDPSPSISRKYYNMNYYIQHNHQEQENGKKKEFEAITGSFNHGIRRNISKKRMNQTRRERRDRVNIIVAQLQSQQNYNNDCNNNDYYKQKYCELQQEHEQLQKERWILQQQLKSININYHCCNVQESMQQMSSDNGQCHMLQPEISNGSTLSTISNGSISSISSNQYTINQQYDIDQYPTNVLLQYNHNYI